MGQVVAGVVAEERQHGHRVAAHDAHGAGGGRGGLRGEGGALEDAVLPVEGLGHQRHGGLAAAAEQDGVQLHAPRVAVLVGQHVRLLDGRAEPGVRVGGRGAGLGRPVVAAPVGEVLGDLVRHALPPHAAVVGEGDVGEDGVALGDRAHGVRVGGPAGAGGDAEVAGLRVDHAELAVLAGADPGDVVAQGLGLPALDRGVDEGEVGLAAGRGEGAGDVVGPALGVGQLEDQHVLGEPGLVPGHHGGDAQRVALLAEQGVAAVAGAEGPDGALLGEVHDPLGLVARPRHVLLARLQRGAHGVHGRHVEGLLAGHLVQHVLADAGHDAHRQDHVGGVGDLHAVLRVLGVEVAHHERDHVHGAAAHGAGERVVEDPVHLRRVHPVVGEAGVLLLLGADEGAVLHTGDVGGIGERGEGVGELVLGQAGQGARRHELVRETVALLLGAVDPLDGVRLRQLCDLSDPLAQLGVVRGRVRQGAIRERGGGVVSHGGESSHWGPGPFRPVHSDACTAEARTTSLWPHGPAMVPEPGYHGRAPATPPTQAAADRRFALRRRGPVVFYEFEPLRRIG
ncbi:Uncharacterised protein [Streptococcus pneumoniae]|nr:Uncharacterised protein [Streptococcus pneumoniae]